VVSQLIIRFDDGSVYDETVRFSQKGAFRLETYHLVQKGPSFRENIDERFDRSGKYQVRRHEAAPGFGANRTASAAPVAIPAAKIPKPG
jgi:hypothetical protein